MFTDYPQRKALFGLISSSQRCKSSAHTHIWALKNPHCDQELGLVERGDWVQMTSSVRPQRTIYSRWTFERLVIPFALQLAHVAGQGFKNLLDNERILNPRILGSPNIPEMSPWKMKARGWGEGVRSSKALLPFVHKMSLWCTTFEPQKSPYWPLLKVPWTNCPPLSTTVQLGTTGLDRNVC